ncbi:unnamed protein product [Lactuca saligna]|uniref:Uncharacterized protein n=1 Tax=Lactuca saligna TaxID=75948 RepID=A0AA36EH75_LACSI|nr:unnamed protein product [Lactuca saligna]
MVRTNFLFFHFLFLSVFFLLPSSPVVAVAAYFYIGGIAVGLAIRIFSILFNLSIAHLISFHQHRTSFCLSDARINFMKSICSLKFQNLNEEKENIQCQVQLMGFSFLVTLFLLMNQGGPKAGRAWPWHRASRCQGASLFIDFLWVSINLGPISDPAAPLVALLFEEPRHVNFKEILK